MLRLLRCVDNEIADLIQQEKERQEQTISLIASESLVPPEIMEVTGSVFTNRSVEGYPGARYYAATKYVDVIEELAISRAKELFGAEYANVQPHTGTNANLAVYLAVLKPRDTVLAMNLADGGHLTHGHPRNFSGQFYHFVHYRVNKVTELLDYDEIEKLATKHQPKMLVAGSSAYSRLIDWERLRAIADKASAYLMTDVAHISGLIAAKVIPSPVPPAHFITSSTYKTIHGPRGGFILAKKEFGPSLNRAVFPGCQSAILIPNVAAKAVAFKKAMTPEFHQLANQIVKNAQTLAQSLQEEGFRIVSGGTDNHLMVVDLRSIGITGKEAQVAMEEAGICANMNLVPFDTEKPTVTSGLRLGTSPVTSRGMKEREMRLIAQVISQTLRNIGNVEVTVKLREQVADICKRFPIPNYAELY